ncbi:zinc-dependent alcohol dehydrogenase [Roseibium sp.]|uniref:zinc-dependent alcohol dehydrogenase n=1 Tax=Roseibium sp. TaxID=1936156 RepID=UPI003A97CA96
MIHAAEGLTATALWFPAAQDCELRAEPLGRVIAGQVQVCTHFSGISRGTEALVFNGKVPQSEWARMRGPNMEGDFGFPVKYGYAVVGQVEAGPRELVGRDVFCLHPHQDRFVVDATQVTPLPEGLTPARAVLAANMETALNIVWDAEILPGDRVAVFGAGVVGALVAYLASQIPGSEVILIDPRSSRQVIAEELDVIFAGAGHQVDGFGAFDILINASASGEALAAALDMAGQEARIVEASWYGETSIPLMLGGAFHARRLKLISSQVGAIPALRRARWDFKRRMAKALELLLDDRLDVLISGETKFEDLAAAYPGILSDPDTLCHRILY